MEVLITLIFILVVLLVGVTLIGHGIWVLLAWFLRQLSGGQPRTSAPPQALNIPPPIRCLHCQAALLSERKYCLRCGASRPSDAEEGLWRELGTTLSQLDRLHKVGVLDANTFRALKTRLEQERERIAFPRGRPGSAEQPPTFTHTTDIRPAPPTPRQTSAVPPKLDEPRRPTTFPPQVVSEQPPPDRTQEFGAWATDSDEVVLKPPLLKPPRRPFAEVMAAFMEQSNIRWGEIIGGLLIVGCSTALVVSLWAQIASIPVLKFLIFTSVTAALFGVGFYTEHRWKLPTTSGGILTIAVLLVPLNFLAIAAASGGTAPTGALVIASEIIAPSLFLCLVYFAGRVITSLWPHVLAASVLGSSIGQLLIRHFGSPQSAPLVLIALGAFPVVCYVTAAAWMLKQALADQEINEAEANQIFVTLSAITFAAALPFGLLLYSSGPPGMSMMHLAPVVTLAGTPMLAGGAILWRRILRPDLAAARTAGTSIALLGTAVVLSGMFLGWPNPASLVPAALLNFVAFTAVAVWLNLPSAHVFAAGCLSFAYIVTFQIFAGHVPWQNPRAVSLLDTTISANTGRALLLPFVLFTLTSEWLKSKARPRDSTAYFQAACGIAVVGLALLMAFGISLSGDPFHIWIFFGLYTAGAFWFAWRSRSVAFTWIGAALLLLTSAQICGPLLSVEFRWQATFLLFAAVSITGALMFRRYGKHERQGLLVLPLVRCAIPGALVATLLLLANMILHEGEPALVLATRTFFLAAIWSGLLVLAGAPVFFTALQTTLALGLILSTRYFLQRVDWYGHQPDVWLHPWALQIQGIVLGLFCLTWTSIRLVARRRLARIEDGGIADAAFKTENEDGSFGQTLRRILDLPLAFDHLLSGTLVTGFTALIVFGAASGISQELTNLARTPQRFDLLGYPHGQILQYGSWICLGILLAVMCGNLKERRRGEFGLGAVVVLWAACFLLAGRFESQLATASATRWFLAIFLLGVSLAYGFGARSFDSAKLGISRAGLAEGGSVLLFLILAPLLFLTLSPVVDAINYVPARGPQAGIFRGMGDLVSYSVPLIFTAAALAIHGLRERSAWFIFAAGLFANLAVTIVHVMSVSAVDGAMDRVVVVESLQLNSIAAAVFTLAWMATRVWWLPTSTTSANSEQVLFKLQKSIPIALNLGLIVPIALHLIALPNRVGRGTFAAGEFTGWLAVLITAVVVIAAARRPGKALSAFYLSGLLLAMGLLGAFATARFGIPRWAGFHVMLGALVAIAWLLVPIRKSPAAVQAEGKLFARWWTSSGLRLEDGWEGRSVLAATAVGAMAIAVALRGPFSDPLGAWWSIGSLLAMSSLGATLNWITLRRAYLYAAGILFNASVSIWVIKYQILSGTAFVEANIIALSVGGVLWLWLELRARRADPRLSQSAVYSFHHLAALLSLVSLAGVVLTRLFSDFFGFYQTMFPLLDAATVVWLAIFLAACLWDRRAWYAVAGLYCLGPLGAITFLHHLGLAPARLGWSLMMTGAIQALVAAAIWRARKPVIAWARRLRIPERMDPTATQLHWLSVFNSSIIATVICLAFWVDLRFFDWPLRIAASIAVGAQALSFGLLAQGPQRRNWQRAAVSMFVLGVVVFGWSWLVPGSSGTWLNRAVILMALTFAFVASFGAGLDKLIEREPDWTKAFSDLAPALSIIGVVSLGFVLCTEVYYQIEFGAVRIKPLALFTVAVTLAAVTVVCIVFALSPKHDPLGLSERRRSMYVYAAEVLLALLFMHIRLTMPWLFTGFLERYWPLVVVAIAYLGVATSEALRRRNVLVLARPIERTGAFLPLLPVAGFWAAQSQVDYSTVLFVVGGLYGLLSILRKSFWFGLIAALAGNGGLWHLLQHTSEYGFGQHPQLWLIPAAISVMIAAHLNRKDFSEAQMAGIRYLALVTIYVSSTADIFINGVARSPWLPLVLAALSLAGVFGGMMFRVRAFLLLGSIFLLLSIATMINYASVNFGWTWLWYVAGIVTGAVIIATFAVFEKKREDVLRLVDGFKEWER